MKAFRFLIVISVLLLTIVLANSPVVASVMQKANFGATAIGPCVAGMGPSSSGIVDYLETARGTFIFQGNASVAPEVVDGLQAYAAEPGTVNARGSITATWSHDGQSYKFIANIYATDSTIGWVESTNEWIIFGGMAGIPYGNPLEYRGVLTVEGERTSIQGPCGMMAVNGIPLGLGDMSVVVTNFTVGTNTIAVFWAEEATSIDIGGGVLVSVPATRVILERVIITGN